MSKITQKISDELNTFISSFVDKGELDLHGTGKAISYIGWFWREVDFTDNFTLGICKTEGNEIEGPADFIGFMENNKWDYKSWSVKEDIRQKIVEMLMSVKRKYDENKVLDYTMLKELDNYIQGLRDRFGECNYCDNKTIEHDALCKSCRAIFTRYQDRLKNSEINGTKYTEADLLELFEPNTEQERLVMNHFLKYSGTKW